MDEHPEFEVPWAFHADDDHRPFFLQHRSPPRKIEHSRQPSSTSSINESILSSAPTSFAFSSDSKSTRPFSHPSSSASSAQKSQLFTEKVRATRFPIRRRPSGVLIQGSEPDSRHTLVGAEASYSESQSWCRTGVSRSRPGFHKDDIIIAVWKYADGGGEFVEHFESVCNRTLLVQKTAEYQNVFRTYERDGQRLHLVDLHGYDFGNSPTWSPMNYDSLITEGIATNAIDGIVYVCDFANNVQCIKSARHWQILKEMSTQCERRAPIAHLATTLPHKMHYDEDETKIPDQETENIYRGTTATRIVERLIGDCLDSFGRHRRDPRSEARTLLIHSSQPQERVSNPPVLDLGDLLTLFIGQATQDLPTQCLVREARSNDDYAHLLGECVYDTIKTMYTQVRSLGPYETNTFTTTLRQLYKHMDLTFCILLAMSLPDNNENFNFDRFEWDFVIPIKKSSFLKKATNMLVSVFRASLRQMLSIGAMTGIESEILNHTKRKTKIERTAKFTIHWNLRDYVWIEVAGSSLRHILTITGSTDNATTMTCQEYINTTWPNSTVDVLGLIDEALKSKEGFSKKELPFEEFSCRDEDESDDTDEDDNDHSINWNPNAYAARVEIKETYTYLFLQYTKKFPPEQLVATGQQLAWLAAALQQNTTSSLQVYNSLFACQYPEIDAKVQYDIVPLINSTLAQKDGQRPKPDCWHALFESPNIVEKFPVSHRPEIAGNFGLEVSRTVLFDLCRTLRTATYDGGIIMYNSRLMIWPTRKETNVNQGPEMKTQHDGHIIQWHVSHTNNPSDDIDVVEKLVECDASRIRLPNLGVPCQTRHFIGFYNPAYVDLGLDRDDKSIKISGLSDEKSNPKVMLHSANFGTSGLGFAGAELEYKIEWPGTTRRPIDLKTYDEILAATKNSSVIIYDAGDKRGWMVPIPSVILQMTQIWMRKNCPGARRPSIQFHSNNNSCPAENAHDTLRDYHDLELKVLLDNKKPFLLQDLVKRMWSDIVECNNQARYGKRQSSSVLEWSKRLRGWEMLQLIFPPPLEIRMKEVKMPSQGCGWEGLQDDLPIFFCKGLGELIKPVNSRSLCSKWSSVPRGQILLTALVGCLQKLSDSRGAGCNCFQLTDKYFWHLTPETNRNFEPCDHAGRPCPKRLQELSKKQSILEMAFPQGAAAIFGLRHGSDLKRKLRSPLSRFPGQIVPNLQEPTIIIDSEQATSQANEVGMADGAIRKQKPSKLENSL